jgi:hypothetical protein
MTLPRYLIMVIWKYILVIFYTLRRKITYQLFDDEYSMPPVPMPRYGLVIIDGEYHPARTNKGWILFHEINYDGTYNYNKLTHEFRDDGY